jgi:hypothetical protein
MTDLRPTHYGDFHSIDRDIGSGDEVHFCGFIHFLNLAYG